MNNVVILSLHLGHGGVENYISNLANILVNEFNVTILCAYQLEEQPAYHIDSRVQIKYLKLGLKPNKKELKQAIHKFQLIKAFKEGLNSIRILRLRSSLMKQAIKQLHQCTIVSTRLLFDSLMVKHKNDDVVALIQEHNDRSHNTKYLKKLQKSVSKADYFMASSKKLTDIYREKLQPSLAKFVYLPCPIEENHHSLSTLDHSACIAVGRLSPEKGFDDLLDVFELIQKDIPNVMLNLVGDGSERPKLEQIIKEKKLENSVILHGLLDHDLVSSLYQTSDLYLMCSHEESFGLVLVEAESYGLPLIAFDSALGATEIIEHGQNGYLIPNRNKEKMASGAVSLLKNQNQTKKMSKNAYSHAEHYFIANVTQMYLSFFKSLDKE